jgi:putative colanic acid biosysnthesis UDP-glucose lipid carrier transferase
MSSPKFRIHPHWSWSDAVHRCADTIVIALGLLVAQWWNTGPRSDRSIAAGAACVVIYYLIAEMTGLFRSWRGVATERELSCTLITWIATLPTAMVLAFAFGYESHLGRSAVFFWFTFAAVGLVGGRLAIRIMLYTLRSKGINTRKYAVVGLNDLGFQLARNIRRSPELGLQLAGFFDDRTPDRLPRLPKDLGKRLGTIGDLVDQARAGRIDNVYIAFPMRAEGRIKNVLAALSDTTASVYVVPDFFVFELLHSRWTNIGGLPAVSVFENPFYGVDGLMKRIADLVLATVFLAFAAVPMMLVAIGIMLTSGRPVFFRQTRYGLDGRSIKVWKFRTMTVCEDGDNVRQATKNDSRVTRLGAVLRRTSLDELPQLFNVLDGSMSLVGPRPHASQQNEGYRKVIKGYMLRHKVKPGITGLAQVNGWRGETDTLDKMQKRVEFDHQYIREWSPWLDVKILFRTVFTVFSKQNAY